MNKENNIDNEMPGTPEEEIANSIDAVLAKVDFDKITKDDVFHDLMHNAKLFSFRLMVASSLLEQLHIRDLAKSGEKKPDNIVGFNENEQEPKS
jgi:hypothetical protein